jgi:hypothetical protein
VVKENHGCGALVLVWEGAKRGERLPTKLGRENWERFAIHPSDLDWEALLNLSDLWMTQNFYHRFGGKYPEWAYLNIDPRIIVEELVVNELATIPTDYKFTMFHRKCDYIAVISGGHGQERLVNLLALNGTTGLPSQITRTIQRIYLSQNIWVKCSNWPKLYRLAQTS